MLRLHMPQGSLPTSMTAFFAAVLGMEIHLLIIMNHPYRGSLGVSPEAFRVVYDMLMR